VSYQIALSAIENKAFRDLVALLSETLAGALPINGNTIRKWILNYYEARKAAFLANLQCNCISRIHIFFNLWTSPHQRAYMAVVIHYINRDYKVRTRLIALRHFRGGHDGTNQAKLLVRIIKEYELKERLRYFVSNNATSCDIAIDFVLCTFFSDLTFTARS
jgi:hypothetical protein